MIKRLLLIFIAAACLFQPQLAFGQGKPVGIEFDYEVTPKETNTTVSNKATMQSSTQGSINSNTVCTEVGESTQKCQVGGGTSALAGWPTDGNLTQGPFGPYSHLPIYNNPLTNKGMSLDIANFLSPNVYPTFTGTVKEVHDCRIALDCQMSYGNYIDIAGPTFYVRYGHLRTGTIPPGLKVGSAVNRTTILGIMGTTGNSTGIHLHWEFRGVEMAIPNIPMNIDPLNCDGNCQLKDKNGKFHPGIVKYDPNEIGSENPGPTDDYWFLLDRANKVEYLYKGVPNDRAKSQLIKTSQVNTGIKNQYPTPLAQKVNPSRPYWVLTSIRETREQEKPTLGEHFLILDIPYTGPNQGPTPYRECGLDGTTQCQWLTPGEFGLHGIAGEDSRLTDAGSSGCVRHSDADIADLYNKLKDVKTEIRYYIEDSTSGTGGLL